VSALVTRALGRTGLDVTALGYGAMELRGARHRNPRALSAGEAERVLNEVLDAGITMIDTSIDYGESEEIIGRAIGHRRDEFVLASKCGCPLEPPVEPRTDPWPHDYTYANVRDGVLQSLRRLQTEHLDLVQFHLSPSREVMERDGGLDALRELQVEGKVRFLGSSSTLPHMPGHIEMGAFEVFQVPWSLLDPAHETVITSAAAAGAGIVVRGGVAKGEPGQGRGREEHWSRWRAAQLDELLDGDTPTQFVLRYTLSQPWLSTTIVGTANVDHLRANLAAAARGPLSPEVLAEADRRVSALDDG
jgi:aryl-alcohol dehydrogenase-like predicted oxidoreductase